jgi:hypothetical protein
MAHGDNAKKNGNTAQVSGKRLGKSHQWFDKDKGIKQRTNRYERRVGKEQCHIT